MVHRGNVSVYVIHQNPEYVGQYERKLQCLFPNQMDSTTRVFKKTPSTKDDDYNLQAKNNKLTSPLMPVSIYILFMQTTSFSGSLIPYVQCTSFLFPIHAELKRSQIDERPLHYAALGNAAQNK